MNDHNKCLNFVFLFEPHPQKMPINKNALKRYRIIDECLTNPMRKYPKLPDIQQKIEAQLDQSISDSMINKDLKAMRDMYGAPIIFHKQHQGYCYAQEGFSIKEFPLTYDEIEALDLAPAMLQQLKGTKLYDQFLHAVNKLIEGYRIGKTLGKGESDIIQTETAAGSPGTNWLEPILKAIIERDCLAVRYTAYGGETKLHNLSPYLLKEYRNRWYVVGYSDRAEMALVLGLDRVKEIKNSKSKFYQDEAFDSAEYFKYSFGITQLHYSVPEKVTLTFIPEQAPYLMSQPIHPSQKVLVNDSNEIKVSIIVYLSHELTQFILGNIDKITDIHPPQLKEVVKGKIISAMKHFCK
jgi:predicted DNA-binding transcriptional regulator YafY